MSSRANQTRTGGRKATEGVIAGKFALSVGNPDTQTNEEWQWIRLTDVARLETGHTPSRKYPEYWNGDIPWIGIKDATSNHGFEINDTFQHVTQKGIDNSSARVLPAKTVCLSRTASVGYMIVMGKPMATSQDFVNWVCTDKIDYRYLASILYAENSSYSLFSRGTTHQTIYFPEAKAFHVLLPSIERQKEIADFIWSINNKIQLNRQTNATLEEIAQSLFKSWFVDFEPVKAKIAAKDSGATPEQIEQAAMCAISGKTLEQLEQLSPATLKELRETAALFPDAMVESELGEIPEGWDVKNLPDVIDFLEGPGIRNWQYTDADDGINFINIRCIKNGDLHLKTANKITKEEAFGKYSHFQLEVDDIVVSTSGTLGRYAFVRSEHLPLSLNTSVIRLREINGISSLHFIAGFVDTKLQFELEIRASGSAQRNFGPMHLRQINMLVPDFQLIKHHFDTIEPLFRQRQCNLKAIDTLELLRDTLLPKLLSGEITPNSVRAADV